MKLYINGELTLEAENFDISVQGNGVSIVKEGQDLAESDMYVVDDSFKLELEK
jgi:hypothetical protein